MTASPFVADITLRAPSKQLSIRSSMQSSREISFVIILTKKSFVGIECALCCVIFFPVYFPVQVTRGATNTWEGNLSAKTIFCQWRKVLVRVQIGEPIRTQY